MNDDQKKRVEYAIGEEMDIVPEDDGTFTVKDKYEVDVVEGTCECPDYEYRHFQCKHILRTVLELQWGTIERVTPDDEDEDDEGVTRPMPLIPEYDQVPETLVNDDHWVCWEMQRDSNPDHAKDWTKVPIDVSGGFASSTDSDTWTDFETAKDYDTSTRDRTDGIGFVVGKSDGYIGIDIDDCRDPDSGEMPSAIEDLIEGVGSYTEVSPSGTGIRIFVRGEWPVSKNQTDIIAGDGVELEVYEWGRYLTVTGHHVAGTPTDVTADQDTIDTFASIMDPGYTPADE